MVMVIVTLTKTFGSHVVQYFVIIPCCFVCLIFFDPVLFLTGSDDFSIRLWDVATSQQIAALAGHTGAVTSLTFDSSGKYLASGEALIRANPSWLHVYTLSCALQFFFPWHMMPVLTCAFSVSADFSLRLWDTHTHADVAVLTGHTSCITSVHFSPSASLIAAASSDACIRLWSTSSGAPVATLTTRTRATICSVAWSSDEALVAAGGCDGGVGVWDSATGLRCSSLQCPETAPVAVITMAPATALIAVAVGPPSTSAHVFSMAPPSLLASPALRGAAEQLRWSADGRCLMDDQGDLWRWP